MEYNFTPTLGELATVDNPPCWAVIGDETFYIDEQFLLDHEGWIVEFDTKSWDGKETFYISPPN